MDFTKIELTRDNILIIIIGFIGLSVIIALVVKASNKESVDDVAPIDFAPVDAPQIVEVPIKAQQEQVSPQETQELAPVAPQSEIPAEITTADLLPANDAAQAFEAKFPSGQGDATDKNFLIAGYNIGINTVGSSLKNANLQLRSDPFIKRQDVGPWNQSTILSSDLTNRRTLEIGS
jgi:hypothetical protein